LKDVFFYDFMQINIISNLIHVSFESKSNYFFSRELLCRDLKNKGGKNNGTIYVAQRRRNTDE